MLHRSIAAGLRRLFRRRDVEHELNDEVEHYLEMATREYMRRGLSRVDAERAARVDFGGVDAAKEQVRGGGWEAVVDALWRDISYAARGLRRAPGFTIAASLTLALGIGVNTAMFSVVNGVMLRPLHFRDARQLMLIWTDDVRRGLHEEATAWSTVGDWRHMNHTLTAVAYYSAGRATLAGNGAGTRERTRRAFVSGNLFATLGVRPAIGRTISDEDERDGTPVAVISYSLWQRRFGADSVVGDKVVALEEAGKDGAGLFRVIGVMPADFQFPDRLTELWTPATTYWRFDRERVERFPDWARRWIAVARLRDDRSVDEVRTDFGAIARRLTTTYGMGPSDFPGFGVNVVPLLDSVAGRRLQSTLWILLGAVALVLGVACANVANLLLARGTARGHEFALRRALGASRGRLVRQLLVESLVLAAIGGVLGVAVAIGATRLVALTAATWLPRVDEIGVDSRVLLFAAVTSVVAGIWFGIAPALRLTGLETAETLHDGGRLAGSKGGRRTRGFLIVAECSLTIVLLVGAGLLLRSLERLRFVDPGFDAGHVLTMRIEFPPETAADRAGADEARARIREQMLNDLATRLADAPGVRNVGFIDDMFITGQGHASIAIPGRTLGATETGELDDGAVTFGFFGTLRVPLRAGRYLTRADALTKIRALWSPITDGQTLEEQARTRLAEPVVVNESFVRRFFPSDSPLGKRFCIDPLHKPYWYVIVGVIGDMHRQGLERQPIPEYFGPLVPSASGRSDLLVRTQGDPLAMAPLIRQVVTSALPNVLINTVATADRQLGDFSAERALQTWLLTSFAALALVLAGVGVYGVVHYAAAERTQEIGIRMALGAEPREVLQLLIAQGMRAPLIGIAIGIVAALAVTRAIAHLLFGTAATDPLTYALVTLTLTAVAACACFVPARRAASIDPIVALRRE